MTSLRKTRDMLFQSYDQRLISEDSLLVLLFYGKRTRLEILNPVTIDNPEMILNVKQSSDLPVLADLSNPFSG